jgi:hypothetical protein
MDIFGHFRIYPEVRTFYKMSGPAGLENPFWKNYYFLMDFDVSKTIAASEISTIMRKLFRSFLGQIGRFWLFVPISE